VELYITRPGTVDDILSLPTAFSHRAVSLVTRQELTGSKFVEPHGIKSKGKGGRYARTIILVRDVYKHRIMWVTGRGGSIAGTHNLLRLSTCRACGRTLWSYPRGDTTFIKVDRRRWDGSDMFYVDQWGAMLMSQRAADALAAEGLSNFTAELNGAIIDPRKPFRAPSRKQRVEENNIYILTALYGDPAERTAGVYKPFWTDFLGGRLGERTLANALRQVKRFRPSGQRWIKDWKWFRG
jgi:hypothetical protein